MQFAWFQKRRRDEMRGVRRGDERGAMMIRIYINRMRFRKEIELEQKQKDWCAQVETEDDMARRSACLQAMSFVPRGFDFGWIFQL